MTVGLKRKICDICPLCSAKVRTFSIDFDASVTMCEQVDCPFPFESDTIESRFITDVSTSNSRYAIFNNEPSGSNSVERITSDSDKIERPIKRPRTDLSTTASGSSKGEISVSDNLGTTKELLDDVRLDPPSAAPQDSSNDQLDIFNVPDWFLPEAPAFEIDKDFDFIEELQSAVCTSEETKKPSDSLSLSSDCETLATHGAFKSPVQPPVTPNLVLPPSSAAKTATLPTNFSTADIESLLSDDSDMFLSKFLL